MCNLKQLFLLPQTPDCLASFLQCIKTKGSAHKQHIQQESKQVIKYTIHQSKNNVTENVCSAYFVEYSVVLFTDTRLQKRQVLKYDRTVLQLVAISCWHMIKECCNILQGKQQQKLPFLLSGQVIQPCQLNVTLIFEYASQQFFFTKVILLK